MAFQEDHWSGDNLLGKILMKIRNANRAIIGNNTDQDMEQWVFDNFTIGYNHVS